MRAIKKNIFVWLSGGDPTALESATISEQRKFIKLGVMILIPAIISWLGMWFAAPYIGINNFQRILASSIWSLIILSIDTYLVTSLDKRLATQHRRRYNQLAFFRILISVFLGIIISHPLVLRILEPNINQEIAKIKKEEEYKIMSDNRDSAAVWNRENKIRLDSVINRIECKEILLKAEGNGIRIKTECGESSGENNRSFRYDRILRELDSLEKYRINLTSDISAINKTFADKNTADLKTLNNFFSYDYLKRTTALKRLKDRDIRNGDFISHTSLLVWLILFFLILIDSIAVISKVIMPSGEHERILTSLETLMRENAERTNEQKRSIYNQILEAEELYKNRMIQAIYSRGAYHNPRDIKIAVESILNNTVEEITNPAVSNNTMRARLVKQYIFLGGASLLGFILWFVLKITVCKDAPNDLAIAMSSYFTIISIIAGILK